MPNISPRAIYRTAAWVFLLWLHGCGGSKPEPARIEAVCAAAAVPLPEGAAQDARDIRDAILRLCAAGKVLGKDGGT